MRTGSHSPSGTEDALRAGAMMGVYTPVNQLLPKDTFANGYEAAKRAGKLGTVLPSERAVMSEVAGALTGWRDGFAQRQRTSLSVV